MAEKITEKPYPDLQCGKRAKLRHNGQEVLIQAVLMDMNGIQYQVSFWEDHTRHVVWVYGVELTGV